MYFRDFLDKLQNETYVVITTDKSDSKNLIICIYLTKKYYLYFIHPHSFDDSKIFYDTFNKERIINELFLAFLLNCDLQCSHDNILIVVQSALFKMLNQIYSKNVKNIKIRCSLELNIHTKHNQYELIKYVLNGSNEIYNIVKPTARYGKRMPRKTI